jgi:hypothetical protein
LAWATAFFKSLSVWRSDLLDLLAVKSPAGWSNQGVQLSSGQDELQTGLMPWGKVNGHPVFDETDRTDRLRDTCSS